VTLDLDLGTALGIVAAALSFGSSLMKRMMPLRALALFSNVFFIGYGYLHWLLPALLLHACLLPLNARRMWELHILTREIRRATHDSPVSQWLLPHMQRARFRAGDVLFRKDNPAEELVYIMSGWVRIEGSQERRGPGELLGEIGIFSAARLQTRTVVCETDGELYRMTAEMVYRLYYENPELGFYFMRLIVDRLMRDLSRTAAPA
jgi:CRP/FNR family cyclic AMP-dependent transcriptional regulator